MRRVIDLSRPVAAGMTVYPGDPEPRIEPVLTVERDGVAVAMVHLGSHTGTHLDAACHVVAGGAAVEAIALERCLAPLHVADVRAAGRRIGPQALSPPREPRVIYALWTGWDEHFDGPRALEHPYLTSAAAERLLEWEIALLATDALSPDATRTDDGGEPDGFPVHEILLRAGVPIAENLAGLGGAAALAAPTAALLPLNLPGVDGSPIRAVAFT